MPLPSLFAFALESEVGASPVEPVSLPTFDSQMGLPPVGSRVASSAGAQAQSNPGFGSTLPRLHNRRGPSWFDPDGDGTPSEVDVMGVPSLRLYLEDGATNIELVRLSRFASRLSTADLSEWRSVGEDVLDRLQAMSRGPYSSKSLAQMGHPYAVTSEKQRRLPRSFNGRRIGAVKGIKGSVPSLTVVNMQSGNFAASWSLQVRLDHEGAALVWRNDAISNRGYPYSWALAGGTNRMRAHGPFTYAPLSFLRQINSAWGRAVRQGWQRAQLDDAAERFLKAA